MFEKRQEVSHLFLVAHCNLLIFFFFNSALPMVLVSLSNMEFGRHVFHEYTSIKIHKKPSHNLHKS